VVILLKNITCGVLYWYKDKFLICHATMTPWWSIPKGLRNDEEILNEAAVRELREETGIVLQTSDLIFVGVFPYRNNKNLALFEYRANKPLNMELLSCTSFFKHEPTGRYLPEVDDYKMVTMDEAKQKLNRNLYKIIRKFTEVRWN
jgi:putative (di)nucleoside polyphosphate hydrolase